MLEIGGGAAGHGRALQELGHDVVYADYSRSRKTYEQMELMPQEYDAVWIHHCLEHMRSPGVTLDKISQELKIGGVLGVVVPPRKDEIVGGHLTLWNAGLLLYNLIRAHFDCSGAAVSSQGYNVAVIVRHKYADYSDLMLNNDAGDIEKLADYFPFPVKQGFNGYIPGYNWNPV